MRSRLLFKANGEVHRMRQTDWLLGVLAALLIVLVLGVANRWDEAGEGDAVAEARGYARGMEAARNELEPKIAAAYKQGVREGMAFASPKPGADLVSYRGSRP